MFRVRGSLNDFFKYVCVVFGLLAMILSYFCWRNVRLRIQSCSNILGDASNRNAQFMNHIKSQNNHKRGSQIRHLFNSWKKFKALWIQYQILEVLSLALTGPSSLECARFKVSRNSCSTSELSHPYFNVGVSTKMWVSWAVPFQI